MVCFVTSHPECFLFLPRHIKYQILNMLLHCCLLIVGKEKLEKLLIFGLKHLMNSAGTFTGRFIHLFFHLRFNEVSLILKCYVSLSLFTLIFAFFYFLDITASQPEITHECVCVSHVFHVTVLNEWKVLKVPTLKIHKNTDASGYRV